MAVLVLIAGMIAAPPAFADDTGSISGVVTDSRGGPVESVLVTAYHEDPVWGWWSWYSQAMTGPDGSYALAALPDGDYRIEFSAAGLPVSLIGEWWADAQDLWSATPVTVEGGAAVAGISPSLDDGGAISGVVTDDSGAGIPYVSVTAQPVGGVVYAYTSTDETGAYTLSGLRGGDHLIEFTPSGPDAAYVAEWWKDAPDISSASPVSVQPGSTIQHVDAALAVGSTISGTVTDDAGEPVAGVQVTVSATRGERYFHAYAGTDDSGAYTVQGVPAGDYTVGYVGPYGRDLVSEWWNDALSEDQAAVVHVGAAESVAGIDAALSAAGFISGQVTDPNGQPGAGVDVSVYRHDVSGDTWAAAISTDETGSFTVRGLASGEYKVQYRPMYGSSLLGEWYSDAADIQSATLIPIVSGGTAVANAELTIGASISGIVTSEAGEPLEGVSVWVAPFQNGELGAGSPTASGPDGAYSITGLAPGEYKVRFTTNDAVDSVLGEWWDDSATEAGATVLTLVAGETSADINPRLAEAAEISGVVVDGAGDGIWSAPVVAYDATGRAAGWAWTGQDGSYSIRGLAAGEYRLGFQQDREDGTQLREWWDNAPDLASADDIVVGDREHVAGIDATLSESDGSVVETFSGALSGTVTDALGQPVPYAHVGIEDASGHIGWDDVSDAAGTWSFDHMPAGTYRVSFTAEIEGTTYTQWWDGAVDRDSATVITLAPGEQRTGIDAVLGAPALPVLTMAEPKITGPERVGKTLKAHVAQRDPQTDFAYGWFADGEPIAGADDEVLILTPDLEGSRISVVVTASQAGYQPVSATSPQTAPVR